MTRSSPARRRGAGFTLAEALIAVTLFILVVGLAGSMFTGMNRDVAKGEDALTSVQDASLILLHLRRDLRRLVFPGEAVQRDLRYTHIRGTDFVQDDLRFDPSTRVFTREHKVSDVETTVYREDKTELEFHIFDSTQEGFEKVTFTYLPEQASIERRLEGQPPKRFAVPRLQDFELQLMVQPEGDAPAVPVLGAETEATPSALQLFFRVRFLVKNERGSGAETTRVEIETRIFPRWVNRALHARWRGTP